MIKETIELHDIGYFSNLISDYLTSDSKVASFYHLNPYQLKDDSSILDKSFEPRKRQLLVDSLREDYKNLALHPSVERNLSYLTSENTFTITTAHQPVIFLGPLYIVYKILQTIELAKVYSTKYPHHHFIPVFYIGSEDHDLEEIGSLQIGNKSYSWNTLQQGACGQMHCEGLLELWNEIKKENKPSPHFDALIQKAYQAHHTMSDAYRILLNDLFGHYGLLVFDANKPLLKKEFTTVLKEEVLKQTSFEVVSKTTEALSKHYHVQAQPRTINLFYKTAGHRERIEAKGNTFQIHGTEFVFNKDELITTIENNPERFSPNVILRPLLQETVLPNIAWIGGGGELAYWLELKTLFEQHKIKMPLLYLRNSFLILNTDNMLAMNQLELKAKQLFQTTREILKAKWMQSEDYIELKKSTETVLKPFQEIQQQARSISSNLVESMKAQEAKTKRITKRIEEKFIAHLIQKDFTYQRQLEELKSKLFPNGQLQERYCSFVDMDVLYGTKFIEGILQNLQPEDSRFTVLTLEQA